MKNQIIKTLKSFEAEKEMPGRGDLSEKDKLNKLASETAAEEKYLSDYMDMKYETARDKYLENNPGKTEEDFIEIINRMKLESGGKVIEFSKYKKDNDWHKTVRKLDLASMFTPGKTLASLSKDEREAVNKLLKLTLGKE